MQYLNVFMAELIENDLKLGPKSYLTTYARKLRKRGMIANETYIYQWPTDLKVIKKKSSYDLKERTKPLPHIKPLKALNYKYKTIPNEKICMYKQ